MNKEQAFNLIEQAIDLGVKKGVFSLQDVSNLLGALVILKPTVENDLAHTPD